MHRLSNVLIISAFCLNKTEQKALLINTLLRLRMLLVLMSLVKIISRFQLLSQGDTS